MSYIINDEVKADLLETANIETVIGEDIQLRRLSKNNLSASCPFHSEKSGSFTVAPSKGFYHCFGCGAHGNVISWMMEFHQLGYRDAIVELAGRVGFELQKFEREKRGDFDPLAKFMNWLDQQLTLSPALLKADLPLNALFDPIIEYAKSLTSEQHGELGFIDDLCISSNLKINEFSEYQAIKKYLVELGINEDRLNGKYLLKVRRKVGDKNYLTDLISFEPTTGHVKEFIHLPLGKKMAESLVGYDQSGNPDLPRVFLHTNVKTYLYGRVFNSQNNNLLAPTITGVISDQQYERAKTFSDRLAGKNGALLTGITFLVSSDRDTKPNSPIISTFVKNSFLSGRSNHNAVLISDANTVTSLTQVNSDSNESLSASKIAITAAFQKASLDIASRIQPADFPTFMSEFKNYTGLEDNIAFDARFLKKMAVALTVNPELACAMIDIHSSSFKEQFIEDYFTYLKARLLLNPQEAAIFYENTMASLSELAKKQSERLLQDGQLVASDHVSVDIASYVSSVVNYSSYFTDPQITNAQNKKEALLKCVNLLSESYESEYIKALLDHASNFNNSGIVANHEYMADKLNNSDRYISGFLSSFNQATIENKLNLIDKSKGKLIDFDSAAIGQATSVVDDENIQTLSPEN